LTRFQRGFFFSVASAVILGFTAPSFASIFKRPALSQSRYAPIADIQFDSSIPKDQYDLMSQDLESLRKFDFSNTDPQLASVMGLRDTSSSSILHWLQDRVHYIVGEKFNPDKQIRSVQKNQTFPFAEQLPDEEEQSAGVTDFGLSNLSSPSIFKVMANIGSEIYASSKVDHAVYTFQVPGVDNIRMTSPRVGIIQIGQGLFAKNVAGMDKEPVQSPVRFAFRMGAFFHEARHSDGHGKSLGFFHAICPVGHEYAGASACDRNLNGPYTVGAHFLNSMARSCKNCSAHDLDMIRLQALDSLNRVLPITVSGVSSDPESAQAAERLRGLTRVIYLCQSIQSMNIAVHSPEICSSLDQVESAMFRTQAEHSELTLHDSTEWDPEPEQISR